MSGTQPLLKNDTEQSINQSATSLVEQISTRLTDKQTRHVTIHAGERKVHINGKNADTSADLTPGISASDDDTQVILYGSDQTAQIPIQSITKVTLDKYVFGDEYLSQIDAVELGVFAERSRSGVRFKSRKWTAMRDASSMPGIYGPPESETLREIGNRFADALEHDDRVKMRLRDGVHIASLWVDSETQEDLAVRAADGRESPDVPDEALQDSVAVAIGDCPLDTNHNELDISAFGYSDQLDTVTERLRTTDIGDELLINDRTNALEVTSYNEDTLELNGNGTTYEIELHSAGFISERRGCVWGSWLNVSGERTLITDVEFKEGEQ